MIWLTDLTTADRHWKQHVGRLTELGAVWDDQTHRINAVLDVSA